MPDASAPAAPPELLRLLAHDLRWQLLTTLTSSDRRVQELVDAVGEPMNLVSYHLKQLREHGLVTVRRSEADGRDVYYSLDVLTLRERFQAAGAALHPALGAFAGSATSPLPRQRVLFVCTHNSARSQMAEGLLRHLSDGQLDVESAGSQPTQIHPDAIRTMDAYGIDIRRQQPKPLSALDGYAFDTVITVCDRAREVCPTFPGGARQLHWGFADPTPIQDADLRQRAFEQIAGALASRIGLFLSSLSTPA